MARASSEVLGQGQVAFDVLAVPSSLRLLRLGVADRAAGMGLDSEAVERARIAEDELAEVEGLVCCLHAEGLLHDGLSEDCRIAV